MICLRKARLSDAPEIVRIRSIVWNETYQGIYPEEMLKNYDLKESCERFASRIADPAHHVYLFFDGDSCVGYFAFGPSNFGPYKDFDLCLNNLYLRREYNGLGLGRQAFQVIYDHCREKHIDKFFCGCNLHNENAVAFYRHMGGIQGDEPVLHDQPYDDIIHFEFYTGVEI